MRTTTFGYGTVEEFPKQQQSKAIGERPQFSVNADPAPFSSSIEQVITGIPDLSKSLRLTRYNLMPSGDPCFRRYTSSIIVNAQPYERRSSISLVRCKAQCLRSQTGPFTCRSFVYDNLNQVCDLFAHVGDQSPARSLPTPRLPYI